MIEQLTAGIDKNSEGNLQSYWTTTTLWKLTVILNYYEAMETFSRIDHNFRSEH
jgi:hypothetical protein